MRTDSIIISTPDNLQLAKKIANRLDIKLQEVDMQIFSDGESKIRMNSVSNKKCIIIHSTHPPTDQHLMQLFMILYKCNKEAVRDIYIVCPYLAYSRQDKEFIQGEVVSIDVVGKILQCIGARKLVTFDIHNQDVLSKLPIDTDNISAIPLLADYMKNYTRLNDPLVISPDNGGIDRAKQLANILHINMSSLTKVRDRITGNVQTRYEGNISVSHRDIIIIDDIISTGNSIINAAKILKDLGAEKLFVLCTHALLLEDAVQRLLNAGINDIIATNSTQNNFAKVDLSSTLSEYIDTFITHAHS